MLSTFVVDVDGSIWFLTVDMKLFFAGPTHAGLSRVREQIRVTLKSPL
jgi:hypothetical protein